MTSTQEALHNERYEINCLLSDPQPTDIIWKSKVIMILYRIANELGLELTETKKKPPKKGQL